VRLALLALAALDKVDDSLYDQFVANRAAQEDPDIAATSLRALWQDTFRTPLLLLAFCRKLDKRSKKRAPSVVMDVPEEGGEDELGDLEHTPIPSESLEFGVDDIGDLVEGLGTDPKRSEAERWAEALD